MNDPADLARARDKLWYRIPVKSRPRRWPPQWLAFYHTVAFKEEQLSIQYYGRVRQICVVKRRDLFPNEPPNSKSDLEYYQLHLESLLSLEQPIRTRKARRNPFISTTWAKFQAAKEINDLFDDSPLEDQLYAELRKQRIQCERQWHETTYRGRFVLDFAVFCNQGKIDLETDGTRWHANPEAALTDSIRDNALVSDGWRILRFYPRRMQEQMAEYCLSPIGRLVKKLDGLENDGLVPRKFFDTAGGLAQQLSFGGADPEEDLD